MKSSEQAQKDVDVLIDLIGKSTMSARQKELALDKIKSICGFVSTLEIETNKIKAQRYGFNYTNFINHTDRLYAFADILGVNDVDIELLKPEHYEFIRHNYRSLKQPINHITIQQIMHALKLYFSFNNDYPKTTIELWKWLKENEYDELIAELNKDVLKKLELINEAL